jgi:periplasmic divalent cation tolerance protein
MLMLAWTSVTEKNDAERLARETVRLGLAACVQIEGPVSSTYVWQGKLETSAEYRVVLKFIPARGRELESWVMKHHPYEVPEWVVVRAEYVSEKYLSWARSNSTSAPF